MPLLKSLKGWFRTWPHPNGVLGLASSEEPLLGALGASGLASISNIRRANVHPLKIVPAGGVSCLL
jgi:hypothetical protein